ncbi:hypothetical protein CSB45_10505 [candidate division KSB3 bacterium]|uniref:Uncharacterized protein n=1 Tax=candidate division KSB3 bacterium TaxID=2044937 RepID=A0A2G6E3J5_9BACT|nr:MAG: hypothetical protein CSB45_10505 [candidate division KSB3 bacterium]PIE29156.1 MAG: hypothetical protein CSA57_10120 [candidate division KSB3 bacterium]
MEAFVPPAEIVLESFHTLADRYSPQHVLWRFDPIVLSSQLPVDAVVEKFSRLAERLKGATERCYISFKAADVRQP